jgi:hypothetical protein
MKEQEIEKLKDTHDKIRQVLEDYGCEEIGDCIVDAICHAVDIPDTLTYYED